MDIYEKWGYSLLSIIAVIYLIAMFVGMIAAFPYGLLGLLLMAGIGILLVKVVIEWLLKQKVKMQTALLP